MWRQDDFVEGKCNVLDITPLIYVNSPSPGLVFNKNMEKDSNIIAIAKAALKEFGADAVAAMEERVPPGCGGAWLRRCAR